MNTDKYQIIHGDCLEVMKTFPDKYFDLVLTSPPFNLGNKHHTGNRYHSPYLDEMNENDYQDWQINILNELERIVADNGSLMYQHKNRIRDGLQITPYEWILKSNWKVKQEIVWYNGSQNFDKIRFYPHTERVYWLAKSGKVVLENTINHHDLFNWKAEGINSIHARAFPLEMALDLISCFPNANKILDPFAGSCTTLIAAKQLGRECVCIEKEEQYVNICKERFATVTNNLF